MENRRPAARCGGGGVGTRSCTDVFEDTDARRRETDCFLIMAWKSRADILESEGKMMVRRTTAFGAAFGCCCCCRGRSACGPSWLLRPEGLISIDGLGEKPSILGRPSETGERTLSGVALPRITGTWFFRPSLGEVALVSFVQAVDFEDVEGERAKSSLSAAWSRPKFSAAWNNCLIASSSEFVCDAPRECEPR